MANEKRLRVLCCPLCRTVEPIEWCGETRGGDDPRCGHPLCEEALHARVVEHTVRVHDGHRYHSNLILFDVLQAEWDNLKDRKRILQNVTRPGEAIPIGAEMYDLKSNFSADAMTCWKQHGRTKNCQDWKAASKRLVPSTKELRKELGLETRDKHRPTAAFLCDYCPVRSIMQSRINSEKYKYNYSE